MHAYVVTCKTIYKILWLEYTGTGVDIYMLYEGIDLENEEFGGRAFDGGFMPVKPCSEFGTQLASLAAGRYAGVAKNANIYRYYS